jgi:outer membrane protein assembly factor BamB
MKIAKNKTAAIAIAVFLMLSMTASVTLLSTTNAHTPPFNIPTWAYISVEPNPVGVGQEAFVNFWIDKAPPTAVAQFGDRWQNFKVTITHPDGTTETLGPFTSDDTGGAFTTFTPTVLGNYTFTFSFPGQTLLGSNPPSGGYSAAIAAMIGDYYEPSTSETVTLQVQQEAVAGYPDVPLPAGYWQNPVYGQNLNWNSISGNWLGLKAVGFTRATGEYNASGNFNPYTTAPLSSHILWIRPLAFGGIIGGEFGNSQYGSSYYSTSQYEPKFGGIVINGILYYQVLPGSSMSPAGWEALNLRTGQELWFKTIGIPLLCGQLVDYISPNQFGGIPYLWATGNPSGDATYSSSTMTGVMLTVPAEQQTMTNPGAYAPVTTSLTGTTYDMYDAMTGNYILSIVNGTSMTLTEDDSGDLIGYYVNASTANMYHAPTLNVWNSSRAILLSQTAAYYGATSANAWYWRPPQNGIIPFSLGIQWTAPLATDISGVPFSPALSISSVGSNVVLMTSVDTTLNAGQSWLPGWRIIAGYSSITGQKLWGPLNETVGAWERVDTEPIVNGMWYEFSHETLTWSAFNANTGQQVWTAEPYNSPAWAYFINYQNIVAYGNLYACDFGGQVHAYDIATGKQVWQFSTGESGTATPYGIWPLVHVEAVGGGVVFVAGGHTYSPPLFLGAKVYAINATTGELVWSASSFDDSNAASALLANGIFVKPNAYDNQLYAFGKGTSKLTVTAPSLGVTTATPITIRGTITDTSAGSQQPIALANFPNGLPCVSDDSMTGWMEYVYMQQPCPTNVTGVPVSIDVLDSNGNYRNIGSTTSDGSGMFTFMWTPDIPGDFTVIATFAGSESYYPSNAETSFYASVPAPTASPYPTVNLPPTEMYVVGMGIAIIIAIAIIGILLLRKKP